MRNIAMQPTKNTQNTLLSCILYINLLPLPCSSLISAQTASALSNELEYSLKYELLNCWYPRTIDQEFGGFCSDYTFDWKPEGRQDKMIVTQARHVWTASEASLFFNDSTYNSAARHGYVFLRDFMWDKKYGGFLQHVNRKGKISGRMKNEGKTAYGNAFALYALSSYYQLSGDSSALNLAKETFNWLEKHSHDSIYGGYFDQMLSDGSNYIIGKSKLGGIDLQKACWKDYNSSIHLLEAFTELYKVWPDQLVNQRIVEMLTLIRDTISDQQGFMNLFFERNWTHVSYRDSTESSQRENLYYDHVSFGHDVETAYLLMEASNVLGFKNDSKTLNLSKKLVDHALLVGWDEQFGGFYDRGYYFNPTDPITITSNAKIWWTQAEGLNALLLMSKLFPDEKEYWDLFVRQWHYIKTYQIDHKYGEWYIEGLDKSPEALYSPKASQWKVNYHNSRALMNCIRMLDSEDTIPH
jgi:cellobiose epimerase